MMPALPKSQVERSDSWGLPCKSIVPPAGLDGPNCLDLATAHAETLPMQIHRRAAVGRDHLAQVADPRGHRIAFNLGMFFRQPHDFLLGPTLDHWHAEILGDCLAAG